MYTDPIMKLKSFAYTLHHTASTLSSTKSFLSIILILLLIIIPTPPPPFSFLSLAIQFHLFLIFMPLKELWEAYSNRTVRPSVSPSRFRVWSISPIFFEVGIPNLVCGYILGWRSVAYHFRVTVTLTLTSDLVFRIIVSGAYLLYYLR